MKVLIACLFYCAFAQSIFAQKPATIAFWNVENLYDTIDDPAINDAEFLPSAKNAWNSERYNTKLKNTAQVILAINGGSGPDILGMAEVENRGVLVDLTTKTDLKKELSLSLFIRYTSCIPFDANCITDPAIITYNRHFPLNKSTSVSGFSSIILKRIKLKT